MVRWCSMQSTQNPSEWKNVKTRNQSNYPSWPSFYYYYHWGAGYHWTPLRVPEHWRRVLTVSQNNDYKTLSDTLPRKNVPTKTHLLSSVCLYISGPRNLYVVLFTWCFRIRKTKSLLLLKWRRNVATHRHQTSCTIPSNDPSYDMTSHSLQDARCVDLSEIWYSYQFACKLSKWINDLNYMSSSYEKTSFPAFKLASARPHRLFAVEYIKQ